MRAAARRYVGVVGRIGIPTAPGPGQQRLGFVSPLVSSLQHRSNVTNQAKLKKKRKPVIPLQPCILEAAKILPTQNILDNFVHHNPLHEFEDMEFNEAIHHIADLERFMSPAARCVALLGVDPRPRVNDALGDLCMSFLDRGAARWKLPNRERGFFHFFSTVESLGFAPWRKKARWYGRRIKEDFALIFPDHTGTTTAEDRELSEYYMREYLRRFQVPEENYTKAFRAQMSELRGWAGMFYNMESNPSEAPEGATVRLIDFLAVRSILMQSSLENIARKARLDITKPASWLKGAPQYREINLSTSQHASAIAFMDQHKDRIADIEGDYKHTLLEAVGTRPIPKPATDRPKLQVWTCIDDREESFRRYLEEANPTNIETFGVAGFFGVPINYAPCDGRDQMTLAPVGNVPQFTMTDYPLEDAQLVAHKAAKRNIALAKLWWENLTMLPVASMISTALFAPVSLTRLYLMSFSPSTALWIQKKFESYYVPKAPSTFVIPFPNDVAAKFVATTLNDIGTRNRMAPLVVILGHGSHTVNNPFRSAYQCGACQGRDGAPNARLFARIVNDPEIRKLLLSEHGIEIPYDTHFVGGGHNTTRDEVTYSDLDMLPDSLKFQFEMADQIIQRACGKNAMERCDRFLLDYPVTSNQALDMVQRRANDFSEMRPELNHATNAAVIIGRRDMTKGRFLDRRSFLLSYDPYNDDDEGTSLQRILTPALVVCSGINLEYLFSTTNADTHGAGTKVPLNVVGNIGAIQGVMGDLRPGLPTQMTEMHTPIRAHYIVDAPASRVEAVLARNNVLMRLVRNEWVKMIVRDPNTNEFYEQKNGKYTLLVSETQQTHMSFDKHRSHGQEIAYYENRTYYLSNVATMGALAAPVAMNYGLFSSPGGGVEAFTYCADQIAVNPRGALVALGATSLTLPTLAFARRYLHGEFMFGRFCGLSVALLAGFNLAATAPSLTHTLAGWSLFGFASTFLIAMYNDRPTVRQNATFAFFNYRLSDAALLTAATFSATHAAFPDSALNDYDPDFIVASSVCLAAYFKSSQFPFTQLLARSMEGPTPSSALGYGALSAHIGVVLLANTVPLWYDYECLRMFLGIGGVGTAVFATLVSHIRADRKGAISYATSGTLGLLYGLVSLGYADTALVLSFGHAACRMVQIFRAPNIIADKEEIRTNIHGPVSLWPSEPPGWLFRMAWRCRRIDTDLNVLEWMDAFSREASSHFKLSRAQQWGATAGIGALIGAPFTPVMHSYEHTFMELAHTDPRMAAALGFTQFSCSVLLLRFLLSRVLDPFRFQRATVFEGDGPKQSGLNLEKADTGPLAALLTSTLLATYLMGNQFMHSISHAEEAEKH